MANVSRPNGFKPVKHRNGSPYNGQATLYYIPSTDGTAVYIGDAVKLAGSADPGFGDAQTVTLAAAGDAIVGIVVGFLPDPTNLNVGGTFRAANTNRYVWVADSPDIIYEVETSNGTLTVVDMGLNANLAVGSPSATMGRSAATIDAGTKNTSAARVFRLVGFVPRPDNDPTAASAKILVSINLHQYVSDTGVTGT